MRNANSQAMKAGKKKSRSFFLVSSMSVRASCAGLRCSQEQSGAGSRGYEDQQQFHVGLVSGVAVFVAAMMEPPCLAVFCSVSLFLGVRPLSRPASP